MARGGPQAAGGSNRRQGSLFRGHSQGTAVRGAEPQAAVQAGWKSSFQTLRHQQNSLSLRNLPDVTCRDVWGLAELARTA